MQPFSLRYGLPSQSLGELQKRLFLKDPTALISGPGIPCALARPQPPLLRASLIRLLILQIFPPSLHPTAVCSPFIQRYHGACTLSKEVEAQSER
jgi:hypothetical protein